MIKAKKIIGIAFIVLITFLCVSILPQKTNYKGENNVEVINQVKQSYQAKELTNFEKKAYFGISILLAFGLIYNGVKSYLYYKKTGQFKFGIFIVNLILFLVIAIITVSVNK